MIEGMQRVRIGLTGLAFVFVLVLLAAVFTSPNEEEPITAGSIEAQFGKDASGGNNLTAADQPKEPLAELGVTPGNADADNQANRAGEVGGP